MGRKKRGISKKICDASVASVIRVLKSGLRRGMSADVEECIIFVENNRDKVSSAYFESARRCGVHVRRSDTERGYNKILETLEKEQTKYDHAYVTGFKQSGRTCLR